LIADELVLLALYSDYEGWSLRPDGLADHDELPLAAHPDGILKQRVTLFAISEVHNLKVAERGATFRKWRLTRRARGKPMTRPRVVSRDEWLAKRMELLEKEKDATRARDALNAARRELPMVKIDKDYVLSGQDGAARLADLFDGRRQLIVYHFMFDPGWDAGCSRCTYFVSNLGRLTYLHERATSFVLISRAPFAKLDSYRRRMGWTLPWYSSFGTDFNYDFGVTMDESVRPADYNYRARADHERAGMPWYTKGEQSGLSVFLRDGDEIFHTYSTYARGLDMLAFTRNFLDLTPLGRQQDDLSYLARI
jgi:predicted dithiol-disulfide oxidoreductase (DUF899 family)